MKTKLLIIALLCYILTYSQDNTKSYYVVQNAGSDITPTLISNNIDGSLNLLFQSNDLQAFLANKKIYKFAKAFNGTQSELLLRTFILTLENNLIDINQFSNFPEIDFVEIIPEAIPLSYPNDIDIPNIGNDRALELVRAPMAWNITTGNPNDMVRNNNNNLAWKNLTVVDVSTGGGGGTVKLGGAIAVHNPKQNIENYNLDFFVENTESGKPIFEEAEVRIILDDVLLKAWKDGGNLASNVEDTRDDHIKIVTGNNASLQNLRMDPNGTGTLTVTYNFLTEEMTNKEKYNYYVTQKTSSTNELVGGELYEIRKDTRPFFEANAGNNITVEKYQPTTLSANNISESVTYNWYDEIGDLIYSGKNLTVSNDITKKYKLEIVAADGFKDYSEVQVTVKPYTFKTLAPNPAINEVLVKYDIENATSTYISIRSLFNNTLYNYILDINTNEKAISLQNYPGGQYIVSLFVNGKLIDSKNLIKN